MDNISRRSSLMDASCMTATSVYLSFDSESTIAGQTCYRTLEGDISAISNISKVEEVCDNTEEKHGNSTLENQNSSVEASPLKTVKKMDVITTNSPLRVLPKNIMREYKALCSTPSKEQLLKTVDVTRGSEANRYDDLGVAFLGVDDGLPAFFPPPPPSTQSVQQRHHNQRCEDNKENISDGSTLSVSSSVEIATSVIERKCLNSVSSVGLMVMEECATAEQNVTEVVIESVHGCNEIQDAQVKDQIIRVQNVEITNVDYNEMGNNVPSEMEFKTDSNMEAGENNVQTDNVIDDLENKNNISNEVVNEILFVIEEEFSQTTPEIHNEVSGSSEANDDPMKNTKNPDTSECEIVAISKDKTSSCEEPMLELGTVIKHQEFTKNNEVQVPTTITEQPNLSQKVNEKPKIPVLKSFGRRSVCEPNLQTNKPSRILNSKGSKRQSILPTLTRKQTTTTDVETEIPMLMNKMLKISNSSTKEETKCDKTDHGTTAETKRILKPTTKQLDKRRSVMSTGTTKGRSSLLPSALGEKRPFSFTQRMSVIVKTTLNSPARKMARKSTMATSSTHLQQQHQRRSMIASRKSDAKVEASVRRSMLPSSKIGTTNNTKARAGLLAPVKEIATQKKTADVGKAPVPGMLKIQESTVLSCPSCKEKFRIKSLLDAHRRSHEGDVTPVQKKPITSQQTIKPAPQPHSILDTSNKCKYCDKQFALVRALHQHLMLHCSKIPPGEKKKLHYTELDHVEKARLPNVFHRGNGSSHSSANSVQATPHLPGKMNAPSLATNTAQKSSYVAKKPVDSSGEKDLKSKPVESTPSNSTGAHSNTISLNNTTSSSCVGSIQKPKKSSAHSGVYRTPSKSVPCHICKLTFKSILDYTNHSLSTHGQKNQNNDDFSAEDELQMT
ncbi:uncharacterized protein LOC101894874 [Musca domestica]|uniref:Uncharacterized protein LOC101894874 n=1 Tax=Musca domestica TaxID=7370 RepID=A0A9J7I302_MUSDO|nr:uncharacterized protein LOC101894874 [Musca domestica]